MSNATQAEVPVSHETLLLVGPIFLGALASFLLFGISIMQLYLYYLNFPQDHKIVKLSVYTIFVLDIFQSITTAGAGWHALCSGWGHPSALEMPGWPFSALPAVSGIVAAWVQIFYAWRIHMLSQWTILPLIIVTVALAQASGALAIAIGFVPLKTVAKLHATNMYARTIVWLGGAVCADVIIAVSMLYLLYAAKRTKYAPTQRLINRLIRLTVETGIATATVATLELILFQVFQTNNLHHFFACLLCKVYSNALMTSLNSRTIFNTEREKSTSSQWVSTFTPAQRFNGTITSPTVVHISSATDVFDPEASVGGYKKNDLTSDNMEMNNIEAREKGRQTLAESR